MTRILYEDSTVSVRTLLGKRPRTDAAKRYLIVFDGGSSFVFDLPEAGEVVIGRSQEAALQLSDAGISRRHSKVMLAEDGAVIADLNSQNGTRVNGDRITGLQRLGPGDVITLSEGVAMVFHGQASSSQAKPFLNTGALRQRIEEDLERYVRFGHPLAVLAIRLADDAPPSALSAALAGRLRLIDAAGFDGPRLLLVVLAETSADDARRTSDDLLAGLTSVGIGATVGYALCPDDGIDVDTLITGARDGASGPGGQVARASEAVTRTQVGSHRIVLADPTMIRLYALLRRLAESELPVLIRGETGVGKEIAATALHAWSKRKDGPLVTLNCAALPENLVESELFGHEAGAFSGATGAKPGLFEAADKGTFFLDEIGELSIAVQAKLLRALETRRVTRLGDRKERSIDVRFLAATHRNLEADVKAGRFRQDLFFRLSAARVMIPPLRDRRRELSVIARELLDQSCDRAGRPRMQISPAAMQMLLSHDWPGNIRELKNALEFAAAIAVGPVLESWQLAETLGTAAGDTEQPVTIPPAAPTRVFRPIDQEIAELERRLIVEALDAADGVKARAAQLISMPVRTFQDKLKQYDLVVPPKGRRPKP